MTDSRLAAPHRAGPGSVSATRTGNRTYEGRNEQGDTVLIGPAGTPGHFSPGELFKLALAGCAGMSSDRVISRRLGDDYEGIVWAHGTSDEKADRYFAVDEEILLDLETLGESERATLATIIGKAIDASCTIARSVRDSVELSTTVNGSPLH
ncbi:OsmC family protein [Luethyella okanaganae]|uniref:OsmC family protein n=1 Tax=Luethyella okanaganae TaxID=69372 RepID=A0ABW1VFZ6_9MICO